MSKTSRKATTPKPELPRRGNVKPSCVAEADAIADWLFAFDMRHAITHTPRESWTDEVWRFYWKMLDDVATLGG